MNKTIEQILFEAERRRKMFHWLVDGLRITGLNISDFDKLNPNWVTKNYNVNI